MGTLSGPLARSTLRHSDTQTLNTRDNIIATMAGANEAELREAFKLFDADGDGMIAAEAKALIHAADKDGNMGIDFGEFAKFWEALHGDDEGKIRAEFGKLDTDNSGYITRDEMVAVISSEFQGDKMEEAKKAIDKLDVDKDGRVSYPEFILVMKYKK